MFANKIVAKINLFAGGATVYRDALHPGTNLLFQTTNPLHKKFIEIRTGNGGKLDPFQQGCTAVHRFVQHTFVELQPGQLAIEIETRILQIDGATCFY
ncbi:MAG: hypothetical protein P8Y96_02640 [Desulfuromonadales bacterium]